MNDYLFDVKLFASIRVKADSEAKARQMMIDHIDASEANLGSWANGNPILCEVSLDEPANDELIEVNGVDADENPFHPESPEGREWSVNHSD